MRSEAGLALVYSAAIAALAILHAYTVATTLNADAVYPLALGKDWAVNGFGAPWIIPPANGLFPDLIVATACAALRLEPYVTVSFCYATFAALLFIAGWFFLESRLPRGVARSASFVSVALLILCGGHGAGLTMLTDTLLSPNFHQGALAVILVSLGLVIRGRWQWLPIVLGVGVLTDPIVVPQAAVLCVLFAAVEGARSRAWRPAALNAASVTAGVAFGFAGRWLLTASLPLTHGSIDASTSPAQSVTSTVALLQGLPQAIDYASAARGWLGVGSLALLAACSWRNGWPPLSVALLIAGIVGVVSPGIAGKWLGPSLVRYQLPLFYLPAFGVTALVVERTSRFKVSRWSPVAAGAIVLVVNVEGVPRLFAKDLLLRDHLALARELQARGVTAVVADYWDAKPLWLMSRGRVAVCQNDRRSVRFTWIVNENWCDEAVRRMRAIERAAVVTHAVRRPEFPFGEPLSVESIGEFRVAWYPSTTVADAMAR